MKKEPQVSIEMSLKSADERTFGVGVGVGVGVGEEEDEDIVNDNNIGNNRKTEVRILRRNNCPNRVMLSRDMSIDICNDESSSSLLMADTGNDDDDAVVIGDIGDEFSDDDATTVHGCDDDGDEELLPLEVDTTDATKMVGANPVNCHDYETVANFSSFSYSIV